MPELANPTIALGIRTAEPQGQSVIANPLALMGTIAQTQGALANARRANIEANAAQQSLMARELAGQFIATSKSPEEAATKIKTNPLTAGFALPVAQDLQTLQNLNLQAQTSEQALAQTGFQGFMKTLIGGVADPAAIDSVAQGYLRTLSPAAAERLAPAVKDIRDGLLAGLPSDPQAARDEFQHRLHGMLLSAGYEGQQIRSAAGLPEPTFTTVTDEQGRPTTYSVGPNASNEIVAKPVGVVTSTGQTIAPMGSAPAGEAPAGSQVAQNDNKPIKTTPQGTTAPALKGISTSEQQRLQQIGAFEGELPAKMNEYTNIAPALNKISVMADALQHFQAGGLAEPRGVAAQTLQGLKNMGLNISDDLINRVGNWSLHDQQVFDADVKTFALGTLKEVAQGRFLKPEADAVLSSLDSEKDPRAILTILNQAQSNLSYNWHKGEEYWHYMRQLADPKTAGDPNDPNSPAHYGKEGYEAWFNKTQADKYFPKGHLGFKSIAPTGIKGIPQKNLDILKSVFGE